MTTTARIDVYFDVVSPYSYLALARMPGWSRRHGVDWRPVPVVYAALLDATGLVGPVEVEAKRRYTFADVRRAAALLGLPMAGPPAHPFRSLEALRLVASQDDPAIARVLAVDLATACWGRGEDLTDAAVLAAAAERCGLGKDALAAIATPAIKTRLRESTEQALAAGVFGVPTMAWEGELFWGHDRLDHLAARIEGRIADPQRGLERWLARPRGADRPGKPRG